MYREDLCISCGKCLFWCPYIEINESDAKMEFRKLQTGQESRIISECVSCMGCDEFCKENAYPFSLILRRQEENNQIHRFSLAEKMFDDTLKKPSSFRKGDVGRPFINLCRLEPMIPNLFEGNLFKGASFFSAGEYYCGYGYLHIGNHSFVEHNTAQLVDRLASSGAKEIICAHDDCYTLYSVMAPAMGIKVPFRPISWPEFLYREMLLMKDRIKPLNRVIAYQQPCASHYTPEKDHYLAKLMDLIGVDRPRRKYEGMNSLCCGIVVMTRNKELWKKTLDLNLDDARKTGAELLATLCPVCYNQLRADAALYGLTAFPISDLCRAAIGETNGRILSFLDKWAE